MVRKNVTFFLFIVCSLVFAANDGIILRDVTPGVYKSEMAIQDKQDAEISRTALNYGGDGWYLGVTPYVGVGSLRSESLGDTVDLRGYVGALLYGRKDSLEFSLNVLLDNFKNHDLRQYHALQYTGSIAFNYDWFQLKAGRESEHFGPGVYNNLTFNRASDAYDMLSMNLDLGPLHVQSFYGSLRVAPWGESNSDFEDRDVFGHRYEVVLKNLTFGISEATILYDNIQPWLFVPTVPLFMEKGNFSEPSNNGVLSFDVEYRFLGVGRVYSEFLLDDMESPIRLIENDNVESKWGWMAGIQLEKDFDLFGRGLRAGTVAEYARVEPYVYTHFYENTAQMAHAGNPLGNPNGPNSQAIDWSVYFTYGNRFKAVLHSKWLWKGTDYGSELNDETSNSLYTPKSFLKGAKMKYSLAPYVSYTVDHVSYQLGLKLFHESEAYGNVVVWW